MLVRRYHDRDRQAVLALAPRLQEGVAAWRDPGKVAAAAMGWVQDSVDAADEPGRAVFVAEDEHGVVGFVATSERAHFTGETDGYVGELVVARRAARTGVGRALMRAAEDWARTRGLRRLSLETGAANGAARSFYDALGFQEEDVRLSKPL